jgi:hypothetical protein
MGETGKMPFSASSLSYDDRSGGLAKVELTAAEITEQITAAVSLTT